MRESESILQTAARQGHPSLQVVAARILGDAKSWSSWEIEHAGLMRRVAAASRLEQQIARLKNVSFDLIHRRALFEYLRDRPLRGEARRQLIAHFHASRSYSHAIISEHNEYVRASGSYLCSAHVGVVVMMDGVFDAPLARYEELYNEYFRVFCDTTLGTATGDATLGAQHAVLPLLKHQLAEHRSRMLAMPRTLPDLDYEMRIRRPTGDTMRMKQLPR
ncbi:MAG: hypothetical protein QM696_00885 [Steroidobacteraceae bacterium]